MDKNTDDLEKMARPSGSPWAKVFWLVIVLAVSSLIVFLSFVWLGKRTIDSTREAAVEIVTAFKAEEVVETFEEWRDLSVTPNEGNILEVATAEATETLSRKTNLEMFGKTLPLGTTVSEITIPATYRYHIDLDGEWFLTSDGSRLLVLAPPLKPSLPIAFDTARMQKKTQSGWARWDGDENLEVLEKTITAKLEERAWNAETIATVRESARDSVAGFVESWLLEKA
ncbi:MAG: hypothetical protein AAGC68_13730, partial [Verrucomicrobiota bacterium]